MSDESSDSHPPSDGDADQESGTHRKVDSATLKRRVIATVKIMGSLIATVAAVLSIRYYLGPAANSLPAAGGNPPSSVSGTSTASSHLSRAADTKGAFPVTTAFATAASRNLPTINAPTSPSESESPIRALQSGTCLTKASTTVPCTAQHDFEIVADSKGCSAAQITGYLGGDRALDVMKLSFRLAKFAGTTYCVADAEGPFRVDSLHGALGGPNAAYLRRCVDNLVGFKEVRCSDPHQQEYVGIGDGVAPSSAQCDQAAAAYMNLTLDRVSDHLAVQVVQDEKLDILHPRCVLQVRGSDVLTNSVRNIRTDALPLTSG